MRAHSEPQKLATSLPGLSEIEGAEARLTARQSARYASQRVADPPLLLIG